MKIDVKEEIIKLLQAVGVNNKQIGHAADQIINFFNRLDSTTLKSDSEILNLKSELTELSKRLNQVEDVIRPLQQAFAPQIDFPSHVDKSTDSAPAPLTNTSTKTRGQPITPYQSSWIKTNCKLEQRTDKLNKNRSYLTLPSVNGRSRSVARDTRGYYQLTDFFKNNDDLALKGLDRNVRADEIESILK